MSYLFVRHKVADYSKWKKVFDEHAEMRKVGGSEGGKLFRSSTNPNELMMLFQWKDSDSAKRFVESASLKEAMEKAGVTDLPDVYFMEKLEKLSY